MKSISDAADLIATARQALLDELLPRLPKDQRYAGLMIANAMAIALREQRAGADAASGESTRIAALLGGASLSGAPPDEDMLASQRRALRNAIRAGTFDDGERTAVLTAHLLRTAADWVAISNPKALRAAGAPA
jgi:uncharacterized protein DUF6285